MDFVPDVKVLGVDELNEYSQYANRWSECDLHDSIDTIMKYRIYFITIFFLYIVLIWICLRWGDIKSLIPLTFELSVLCVLTIVTPMIAELKDRVFLCMMMPTFVLLFRNFIDIPKNNNIFIKLFLVCALAPMIFKFSKHICESHDSYMERNEITVTTNELLYDVNNVVYLMDFDVRTINPYKVVDFPVRPVSLGWFSNIPFNHGLLMGHDDFIKNEIFILSEDTLKTRLIQKTYSKITMLIRIVI